MDESDVRRSQILDVLDHEITRLTADTQWAGLTVWALLGALAGVGWLASEELKSSTLSHQPLKIAFLWLLFSLLFDCLSWLSLLLDGGAAIRQDWQSPRILAANRYLQRAAPRESMALSICRSVALLYVLALVGGPNFGRVLSGLLIVTLSLAILISALALVISFTELPFVIDKPRLPKPLVNVAMKVGGGLAVTLVSIAMISKSRLIIQGASWTEIRVGALACVAVWLVNKVSGLSSSKENVDRLQDARRDLGLGVVGPDEAKRILERALTGEEAARVVDELATPALATLNRMIDEHRTRERDAIRLTEQVSAVNGPLGHDVVAQIRAFMTSSISGSKKTMAEANEELPKVFAARRSLQRLVGGSVKELPMARQREINERLVEFMAASRDATDANSELIRLADSKGYVN